MVELFRNLFREEFIPHGHCFLWNPGVLWLHVISDLLIGVAYFSIPIALIYFVHRRTDLAFSWIFIMFGIFIFACGTTHFFEIWTIWHGDYWIAGIIKVATALVSVATAVILWPLIPKLLALPSPSQLEAANRRLEEQVRERIRAEDEVRKVNSNLEKLVEQRTTELKRSNEDLEHFAYLASHDLQEPLRMVGSYIQLVEERYKEKLDCEGKEFIEFAVGGVNRMHGLIRDLLAYCRMKSQPIQFQRVDCNAALNVALMNLKIPIEQADATTTHNSLPTIEGDESQLIQIFQNLLSNAIKYRSQKPLHISVSAEPKDDVWLFSVNDNGIGFDIQYAERIFQLFKRLHGSKYPGTGMGLAICKRLVENHGGKIWVESVVEEGSTFYFTVPRKDGFSGN